MMIVIVVMVKLMLGMMVNDGSNFVMMMIVVPIEVTLLGIVTVVSNVHDLKALAPIGLIMMMIMWMMNSDDGVE